jgi:hypothetical protein
VIVGFGATFAYPFFFTAGARLDPRAMPWFFSMLGAVQALIVVLTVFFMATHAGA